MNKADDGVEQGRFVLPGWGGGASKRGFEQGLEGIGIWAGGERVLRASGQRTAGAGVSGRARGLEGKRDAGLRDLPQGRNSDLQGGPWMDWWPPSIPESHAKAPL